MVSRSTVMARQVDASALSRFTRALGDARWEHACAYTETLPLLPENVDYPVTYRTPSTYTELF